MSTDQWIEIAATGVALISAIVAAMSALYAKRWSRFVSERLWELRRESYAPVSSVIHQVAALVSDTAMAPGAPDLSEGNEPLLAALRTAETNLRDALNSAEARWLSEDAVSVAESLQAGLLLLLDNDDASILSDVGRLKRRFDRIERNDLLRP